MCRFIEIWPALFFCLERKREELVSLLGLSYRITINLLLQELAIFIQMKYFIDVVLAGNQMH